MRLGFISIAGLLLLLTGCTSISPVGTLGPQKLNVYSVANNDFLSASRMLVVLNQKGDVVAYTGGTVAGGGTVALQTGSTLASAGAIYYGSKAIQHGLQNTNVHMKGIPTNYNINANANANIDINGYLKK